VTTVTAEYLRAVYDRLPKVPDLDDIDYRAEPDPLSDPVDSPMLDARPPDPPWFLQLVSERGYPWMAPLVPVFEPFRRDGAA
jgi:hypothetical protein